MIVTAVAVVAPIVGYAFLATEGLLWAFAAVQVVTVFAIASTWLSTQRNLDLARSQQLHLVDDATERFTTALEQASASLNDRTASLNDRLGTVQEDLRDGSREESQELGRRVDEIRRRTRDELKRQHGITRRAVTAELDKQYHQVEFLLALYYDLRPNRSFPKTRSWAASPDLLHYLYRYVLQKRPQQILECGSGLSTLIFAYALRGTGDAGRVIALEHSDDYAASTRQLLEEHELTEYAEVRLAPLTDVHIGGEVWTWYDPAALPAGPIEVALVDGPPGDLGSHARFPALPMLLDRLAPAADVFLDDTGRQEESEIVGLWTEPLRGVRVEELAHEKGTTRLTLLQTSDGAPHPSDPAPWGEIGS